MNPYCFVITSYGEKPDVKDLQRKIDSRDLNPPVQKINFDTIYRDLIEPAIRAAEMEPLIEHQEPSFGSIHKTMYEKIILCEFCVTDLTNVNPNVYYELGMRYAVRQYTTIPIIASSLFPLPFDIGFNRTIVYKVDNNYNLTNKDEDIKSITNALIRARESRDTDSPLYDMVNGISFQNSVAHEKTDLFRQKVIYDTKIREKLAYAREATSYDPNKEKEVRIKAIDDVVQAYQPLDSIETGVLIDMMISYRNIGAMQEMLQFIEQLPRYVFETVMVQEQYAFALNRVGSKKKPEDKIMIRKAEQVLKKLEDDGKASSESYGIWGRIHKDKFDRAYSQGDTGEARAHLENAKEYYKRGFEFDIRDAYPGVNYVTCLELLGENKQAMRLVPVVEQAALSKMKQKDPDYWDYATLLELALIEGRNEEAEKLFYKAKPLATETWMFGTTRNNLEIITRFRKERGEDTVVLEKIIQLLQ